MILTCPNCATRYQTDAALLGDAGRKVRCARCGHVWLQPPAIPEPEPETQAFEEPAAQESWPEPVTHSAYAPSEGQVEAPEIDEPRQAPSHSWPERAAIAGGWAGLILVVLATGFAAERFRQQIALVWPQSASIYAALGERVDTRGFEFENVSYHNETDDGEAVLTVHGSLQNITSHELPVPPIRVTLTDGERRVLYDWSFSANVATLRPSQSVTFQTRLTNPPGGATHMQLRLAESGQ